jgi:thiamine-phosphate pyrophosphorylase
MARRISNQHRPILCAVLDGAALGSEPREVAMRLFLEGVDWVQLRDRTLESEALFRLGAALVSAARDAEAAIEGSVGKDLPAPRREPRVIVNRRVDIAIACAADGVHLGFDALEPASARRLLGTNALIGASLHSALEVETASEGGLSYVHLAPIWNPISKPASRPPLGSRALASAARFGLPVLAQGGLDAARATEAIEAGAAGIAVTGLLTRADDPVAVAKTLRQALDQAMPPTGPISRNHTPLIGDTERMP